ncbi:aldo/keto reductase [Conexibacter sp. JD483]|uniref:aldo/keto reductase n=1 Tax=unclassified Conexibacter TaxID=2627773 RepID=UPI0027284AE1|nr:MULTISPECIES: aldo/keto reductase [unclassified Conexibacter]MDO8186582.1 aldo/keto reductase [Conexibacter sp. CPCC 205706]MDO8196687.1 aldo/keto reductase [Conexibacter sp. CPCC 205762]MDR9372659.1 aldo/keto reductase [Conexibacter sp. JD483]
MSQIGLGLAAIGRPAYINIGRDSDLGADRSVETLRREAWELLDAALAAGVRWVDAARSYGLAEEFLAGWLDARSLAADVLTISSKWGYAYVGDWRMDADVHERKQLDAAQLRRQLAETRALLGDQLDMYAIHSATIESGVLEDADVLAQLASLRASGVRVGLSTTGPAQAATIDRAVELGAFDAVQSTWNLHERSAGDALARAHAAGLTVLIKEGVANGRLTAHAAPPPLSAAAADLDTTPDALALAAILARPWVDVVLSGAVSPAMLASNLAASSVEWNDSLEARLAVLSEDPESYWRTRSELVWS